MMHMHMTLFLKLVNISLALSAIVFFTSIAHAVDVTDSDKVNPIVKPEWLYKTFSDKKPVQIVDVRLAADFSIEHIPGAINLPVNLTFDNQVDRTRIASLDKIKKTFSKAGIKKDSYVILYDDGLLKDASHVFWVMETYGHIRVGVLDGGLPAWKSLSAPVTSQISDVTESNYIPNIVVRRLSTMLTTRLAMDNSKVAIVDSRSGEEYRGESSKAKQIGHIPGAISIPWGENLAEVNGLPRVKKSDELKKLYSRTDSFDETIVYCNRGKESAQTYLIMRSLGIPVSVYDGAWLEWGNDLRMPVAK